MVQAYWTIGKLIVEHEQNGEKRAEYGKGVLESLAARLTREFGRGYDASNLRYMRLFFQNFPIRDALRHELLWTHYRLLVKVKDETARMWYMNEAANETWSTRQLDRQISVLYFERLLSSQNVGSVKKEAAEKMKEMRPNEFIRDPYVLDFLNLGDYPAIHETDVEQGLIDHLQKFLLELGKGFCFVARQKLMRYGDEAVVKYSVLNDAKQMFASKYQLNLPSIEDLEKVVRENRYEIERKALCKECKDG